MEDGMGKGGEIDILAFYVSIMKVTLLLEASD